MNKDKKLFNKVKQKRYRLIDVLEVDMVVVNVV